MLKEQKGITLIALVITIIVLLILAGITIAMIGSQDSAPNKAAEAKIVNEVGAAKDSIVIKASTAVEKWYEDKYVSSSSSAKVCAGAEVAAQLSATNGVDFGSEVEWGTQPPAITTADGTSTFVIKSKSASPSDSSKFYKISGTIQSNGSITWQAGAWQ